MKQRDRKRFEDFLRWMPREWTDIKELVVMCGIPRKQLSYLLLVAKRKGLVEHRRVGRNKYQWRRV